MKRKIVAIFAMFLMISIPFGIVDAREVKEKESIRLEIASISEEGNILIEEFFTNEEELTIFQGLISELFEKIRNSQNLGEILQILQMFRGRNNRLFKIVFKMLTRNRLFNNRAFVLSSGTCYDLNPLKQDQVKIRKRTTFWRYSSGTINSRTFILRPFQLNNKVLTGTQFGFMRKFTGIYIHISRTIPEKSYTFFMGTAKNAFGLDFTPNPQI